MHPPGERTARPGGADAQALAEAVAKAILGRDQAAQSLGIVLEEIRAGYARVRMRVRSDLLNAHRTCHGGLIFALADSAFELACNSYDEVAVASGCTIEFLAPAGEGDELVAVAEERARTPRTGVYDVQVTKTDGEPVACFRGRSVSRRESVLQTRTPEAEAR